MRSKVIGFVLAAALPSACGPLVVHDQQSSLINSVEYGTQASRGDVPVLVLGNIAGLDATRLADAVVARMQGADWPPHARFVPATATSQAIYSYVMVFNGPAEMTSAALCARRSAPSTVAAARVGDTVLVAGLCRYDQVASGVTARTVVVTGPDDPQFRDLIVSAMLELTRTQGRQHNDSSDGKGDKS